MQYLNHICGILHLSRHIFQIQKLFVLQKKLQIIIFETVMLINLLCLENSILKYFNKFLPRVFKTWSTFSSELCTYNTCWSNLIVPPHDTKLYGSNSVNISAIYI